MVDSTTAHRQKLIAFEVLRITRPQPSKNRNAQFVVDESN